MLISENHKTGSQVARELGISRAAVSQSLKKSTKKIYNWFRKDHSPYECFQLMGKMTNCVHEDDMKDLFRLLPLTIQKEVRKDYIT